VNKISPAIRGLSSLSSNARLVPHREDEHNSAQYRNDSVNYNRRTRSTIPGGMSLTFGSVYLDFSGLKEENGGWMTILTRSGLQQIRVFRTTQIHEGKTKSIYG
jgi:hypothetical protein